MIAHSTMAPPSRWSTTPAATPAASLKKGTDRESGASTAFAQYRPAAANGATATVHDAGTNRARFRPAAQKAALQAMPGYIDGSRILRNIVKQWEEQGVSPEMIDAIRNGVPRPPSARHAPAILALGAALEASGDYDRLRAQAMNVYRGTYAWKNALAQLQAGHPGQGREQLEGQLADTMFRLDGRHHRHRAAVLDLLLRPEAIIDLDADEMDIDAGIVDSYSDGTGVDTGMMTRRGGTPPSYA